MNTTMTNCSSCHSTHSKPLSESCIARVPIFSKLTDEEMLEIAKVTHDKKFEKGEAIFLPGDKLDKLYVIHQGKVKVSRISLEGKEQIIRVMQPGEFLGELVLFSPQVASSSAEALETTVVCEIESSTIKELMLNSSTIALKVLEEVSRRLEKVENLVENIGLYDVEKRIAIAILDLADNKLDVELPVSKKDFASQINMTQETLSRKLAFFQENGWIKLIGQRKIQILDRESLEGIIS